MPTIESPLFPCWGRHSRMGHNVIVGEFSAVKFYRGLEFRIETSDTAGTRWDQNLIGFRGEEEIGFHAGSAINVGAFQLTTSVIP